MRQSVCVALKHPILNIKYTSLQFLLCKKSNNFFKIKELEYVINYSDFKGNLEYKVKSPCTIKYL